VISKLKYRIWDPNKDICLLSRYSSKKCDTLVQEEVVLVVVCGVCEPLFVEQKK
jgi:hypothetical protein